MTEKEEQKCREAFESFWLSVYGWSLYRDEVGNYFSEKERHAWHAWASCWGRLGGPDKTVKEVKFRGIDGWSRPVFQAANSEFYGATDILFECDATESDVLTKVSEKDLTYFGSRFGCEPMGSPAGNIKIVRK